MGGLDELELVWRGDYMHRRAVSEFLRDKVRLRPLSRGLCRPLAACAAGSDRSRHCRRRLRQFVGSKRLVSMPDRVTNTVRMSP